MASGPLPNLIASCMLTNCSIGSVPIMTVSYWSLLHNKSRGLALGQQIGGIKELEEDLAGKRITRITERLNNFHIGGVRGLHTLAFIERLELMHLVTGETNPFMLSP